MTRAVDSLNDPLKQQMGGFERLSKTVFSGELPLILTQLQEGVWVRA
ncbi:hypothetical protein [Deinococcus puniceus]|nr:hypothetical protein [Deinococcus puniceus]